VLLAAWFAGRSNLAIADDCSTISDDGSNVCVTCQSLNAFDCTSVMCGTRDPSTGNWEATWGYDVCPYEVYWGDCWWYHPILGYVIAR
jgi:hypothetical protein